MGSPHVFRDVQGIRKFSREQRRNGKTVGFVPTMVCRIVGALRRSPWCSGGTGRHAITLWVCVLLATLQGYLHDGHISLVRAARWAGDAPMGPSLDETVGRPVGRSPLPLPFHLLLPLLQGAVRRGHRLHLRQPHAVLQE